MFVFITITYHVNLMEIKMLLHMKVTLQHVDYVMGILRHSKTNCIYVEPRHVN